jgi:hypothetical protein
MRHLTIRLPRPTISQKRFELSKAKRKVIVAGRRSGKTTGMAMLAVKAMLAGYRVLEAAPVVDQTNAFWENCKTFLAEAIRAGVVYKNESDRVLQLPGYPIHAGPVPSPLLLKELKVGEIPTAPRIKAKTAWNADTLRGDWADVLLLDEYSIMSPTVWSEVGAPMLLDNDGICVFGFTPKRKNHAYAHYVRGIRDETKRWESFHFTSLDNPHLSPIALQEITEDLTSEMYEQEILAKFLDNDGVLFRHVKECTKGKPGRPEDHVGHYKVIGGDWGQKVDYTAFSVGCADCRVELDIDRFRHIGYEVQKSRLRSLCQKWDPNVVLLELNSIGLPIFQSLEMDGNLPLMGFETTGQSKPRMIQNLELVLDRKEWTFLEDDIWTAELEAFEEKISSSTGRSSYAAPEGIHDDTVISRGLMVWGSNSRKSLFL